MRITASAARRLILRSQGLDGAWKLPAGKEGVAQTVERLGYVQIDTIAVVHRAHHHTLWSRRADYAPGMLHELQAVDRRVFEYWTHAASYVPMRDYRYYLPRMRRYAQRPREQGFIRKNGKLIKEVVTRIRKEGPLASADFKAPEGRKRGSWWDWKPAKHALEMLFSMGELMVSERRNFQRVYDLTERVLPVDIDTTEPDTDEEARFTVRRVLRANGVCDLNHWSLRRNSAIPRALDALEGAGEVVEVNVAGIDGGPFYALTDVVASAARASARKRVHLISPFDSLVISRQRVRKFFDFECKLECYLPAPQRRWGYFCLPILVGDRFVGRLDPKADRKARTLIVRKLLFEPDFKDYDAVLPALAAKLRDFAAFNDCDETVVAETAPRRARAALRRELSGR